MTKIGSQMINTIQAPQLEKFFHFNSSSFTIQMILETKLNVARLCEENGGKFN